jgi:hypothetical protein
MERISDISELTPEEINDLLEKPFSVVYDSAGIHVSLEGEDDEGRKKLTKNGIVFLRFLERWTDVSVNWDEIDEVADVEFLE